LPATLIDGLSDYVAKLTVHRIKNGTHWLVHEQPARVRQLVADFLSQDKAGRTAGERTTRISARAHDGHQ
jgi:hypothetical protein